MMENKYRDALMIPLSENELLVMACDSCGAIGIKDQDKVKVSPFIAGKYTARVSLIEVLSLGAKIKGVMVNICNELDPTGQNILDGIESELCECNIKVPMSFSTEKNMITNMTALGVTVVGVVNRAQLLMSQSRFGDFVYVVGKPKVGNEVVEDQGEIANTAVLLDLLKMDNIQEIIPVGSSGIEGELDRFLEFNQLKLKFTEDLPIDIHKSAGPCTSLIVISRREIKGEGNIPYYYIGKLY